MLEPAPAGSAGAQIRPEDLLLKTPNVESAEKTSPVAPAPASPQFVSLSPSRPERDSGDLWQDLRRQISEAGPIASQKPGETPPASPMETGVSIITALNEAPPRTRHSGAIVHSSPLSASVRTMLETREFGRRYDTLPADRSAIEQLLPGLQCPQGKVEFLASDRSFEDLSFSVDQLLQHRKKLLAPTVNPKRARRNVLVLGAGPGGLMAAIQLSLRDHRVVVCEQRDVYTRNRFIGVYKEVSHLMAALGMPERMTYDFSQYRGKRGLMLADIQTFLHGVALKLGVIIYTGAIARSLSLQALQNGEIELQRASRGTGGAPGQPSVGMTRWQYDTVARVRSGVSIRFDTILEATGGRSGLREVLVGPENVVSLRVIGRAAAARDPSLKSYLSDPEDHCAQFVESAYGPPPEMLQPFASTLLNGEDSELPVELPCFVSNIDVSVFKKYIVVSTRSARVGEKDLDIPRDWVIAECRLSDQTLTRYHVEGPLPQHFEFGGQRLATSAALEKLNPVSLLLRILYAMGVPFDAIDRQKLIEYYMAENSFGDTSDIVATWVGGFRGLRVGGKKPIWIGNVPGSEIIEYGIIGEALQNAWYRFGVGVDDTFAGAALFAECAELEHDKRLAKAASFERVLTARSVQILYHLYSVTRDQSQGVVGPVLTEYHMDDQHSADLAEARLRELVRQGLEMRAAEIDIRSGASDPLLEAAFDYHRHGCCSRALALLESSPNYQREAFERARHIMKRGDGDWRARAFAALHTTLSSQHRELLAPLFARADSASYQAASPAGLRQERLVELALGRYSWASPWLRACALRALDIAASGAMTALTRARSDPDVLVAETASAVLSRSETPATSGGHYTTIDKVLMLKEVNLFREIPHQVLAGIAALLIDRWAEPQERIIAEGELGDCLYVIASGRVRIHHGERTFRFLERNQSFGELSLLDAEPRSASVMAIERTHLFRLAQSDFYSLMTEQPDIIQAINRVLCEMVRCANAAVASIPPGQSHW